MKNLKLGTILKRDKHTESLKPFLIASLARTVFFPDGKTLLEKWESDIKSSIIIKHTEEIAELEDSSYKWSCTTYGDKKFQLSGHFRPSIDPSPLIINTGDGFIDQYKFSIPLPIDFAEGRTANIANASIIIIEGHESNFMSKHTIHNVYYEYKGGILSIYVNHFKGLDSIDVTVLPYITGDFNIFVDGVFI